jgi:hypothetical protein
MNIHGKCERQQGRISLLNTYYCISIQRVYSYWTKFWDIRGKLTEDLKVVCVAHAVAEAFTNHHQMILIGIGQDDQQLTHRSLVT